MVIIKTPKEIEIMRRGGHILSGILAEIGKLVKPGATTGELEELARRLIASAGGRPSFLGYKTMFEAKGFPTALCTSINHEVVHAPALPARTLKEGDVIGVDVGMEYPFGRDLKGYYTDMAATFPVGRIDKEAARLVKVTKRSLDAGIKQVKPGNTLNDIGTAVSAVAAAGKLAVVRDLVGHGVGTAVHEEPQVPNYPVHSRGYDNLALVPGMVIAIEPMINLGTHKVTSLDDGFTIATADGKLSAHFEHTVAVTEKGCEILTI